VGSFGLTNPSRVCTVRVEKSINLSTNSGIDKRGGGGGFMAFYLLELDSPSGDQAAVTAAIDRIASLSQEAGGAVVEAQVSAAQQRVYVVIEHDHRDRLAKALAAAGLPSDDLAEVRLVGATIEDVKARRGTAQYLVEWDFPEGLEMDTYLARKKEKAPLYAHVPEVRFLRTWVREDMVKCLCLYEAPDEDAVVRAREAVQTPIDRLTKLAAPEHVAG